MKRTTPPATTFGSEVTDTERTTRVAGSDSVRERLAIIFLRTHEGGHSKRHTKRHTAGIQARKSTRDPNSTLGIKYMRRAGTRGNRSAYGRPPTDRGGEAHTGLLKERNTIRVDTLHNRTATGISRARS